MGAVEDKHPSKVFGEGHKGVDAGAGLVVVFYDDVPGLALRHVLGPGLNLTKRKQNVSFACLQTAVT